MKGEKNDTSVALERGANGNEAVMPEVQIGNGGDYCKVNGKRHNHNYQMSKVQRKESCVVQAVPDEEIVRFCPWCKGYFTGNACQCGFRV